MKYVYSLLILLTCAGTTFAQIDSTLLLKRTQVDTTRTKMNMDAVYNRPFLTMGKIPVSLGGYVEANWQHLGTNGVSEGHQFQMKRLTLVVRVEYIKRIKFPSKSNLKTARKK